MLDGVVKEGKWLLGDKTGGTDGDKTVSLPIQAWYLTNGVQTLAADERRRD